MSEVVRQSGLEHLVEHLADLLELVHGQGVDLLLEVLRDVGEVGAAPLVVHEVDSEAGLAVASRATDAVQVGLGVGASVGRHAGRRNVEVDDEGDLKGMRKGEETRKEGENGLGARRCRGRERWW